MLSILKVQKKKKEERERETDRTVLACISNYQSQSNCYCWNHTQTPFLYPEETALKLRCIRPWGLKVGSGKRNC